MKYRTLLKVLLLRERHATNLSLFSAISERISKTVNFRFPCIKEKIETKAQHSQKDLKTKSMLFFFQIELRGLPKN